MSKTKLKSCPFCGSENIVKRYIVECFDCRATAQDERLWNMRIEAKQENKNAICIVQSAVQGWEEIK
ncbi:MAG: hypothetical protein V8Q39_00200 [Anaerovoracaceae bacterium]